MKYIHGQMLQHSLLTLYWGAVLLALYWGAVATSGGFRFRQSHQGVGKADSRYKELNEQAVIGEQPIDKPFRDHKDGTLFRPLSDDEKLKDALGTMLRHIHIVRDCCEHLEPE